ncbi:MAG: nuclear transport factor 2 family protein [Hyphomonadaceae bacterium]|nr:nuclear transport factor 2 family protein [Hyphomonadaceae bacterium]
MSSEDRLHRIEAELAIRNVIARYGMAADCGDVETALSCHTADAVYVVSNPRAGRNGEAGDLELKGHSAIGDMLSSEMHQSLLPDCAHTVGPLVVEVSGNAGRVIGYSRVYHDQKLMRLAINIWDMSLDHGNWKIARRESRVMGEEKAQALLKKALNK